MRNQLFFYAMLLFCFHLYANTEAVGAVKFYPPLILKNSTECQGVRVSSDKLVMTEECIKAHRYQKIQSRMAISLDNEKYGLININADKVTAYREGYLGTVLLVDADDKYDDAKFLFAEKLYHFDFTGIKSTYKALFINNDELFDMEVDLNTLEYPFLVTGFSPDLSLPSGTMIIDQNKRILCLLMSDGACATFDTYTTSLIQEVQKRIHTSILKKPDGDCCYATTDELYFNCITYCAINPGNCIPCPNCRHKNSSPVSILSFVGAAALLATTIVTISAIYSPIYPQAYKSKGSL